MAEEHSNDQTEGLFGDDISSSSDSDIADIPEPRNEKNNQQIPISPSEQNKSRSPFGNSASLTHIDLQSENHQSASDIYRDALAELGLDTNSKPIFEPTFKTDEVKPEIKPDIKPNIFLAPELPPPSGNKKTAKLEPMDANDDPWEDASEETSFDTVDGLLPTAEQLEKEPERLRDIILLGNMDKTRINRYCMFRRSAIPKPVVRRIMVDTLAGRAPQPQPQVLIAVAGVAKIMVGQMIEKALENKEKSCNDHYPITPNELRFALTQLNEKGLTYPLGSNINAQYPDRTSTSELKIE